MSRKTFGSFFRRKEQPKQIQNRATVEFIQPETKNIASLEVAFANQNQAWVELKILSNNFDPFEIKLNLFLTTFAEIMFQLKQENEANQLREYLSEIVSFMLDTPLNLEDRPNILGPHIELMVRPGKSQSPMQKMTTILQLTTPGNLLSTDFLFSSKDDNSFLATCLTLILQDFIYSLDKAELRKLLKATQAMEAFYQTVKEPGEASARKEAPVYAKRSIS